MLTPEAMLQKGEDEMLGICGFSILRSFGNECADLLTLPIITALPTTWEALERPNTVPGSMKA